jgi:hypothetical protein
MTTTIITPSGAPVEGVRIVDMPDLGAVTDDTSFVGEHAGSGRFSATALRSYVGTSPSGTVTFTDGVHTVAGSNLAVTGGTIGGTSPNATLTIVPGTGTGGMTDIANVMDFGADPTGLTDSKAAFQAAINTGKTVYIPARGAGIYRINGQINCTTPGQIIFGDGKGRSIIKVDAAFNLSATGVFVINLPPPKVPGPQFRDFQINFIQPDTAIRANLVAYPPAFYAEDEARGTWHGIKVNAAQICMDLRQNAGGSSIVDCELCAFDKHVAIDGSLDSITIADTRFENDLLTANQTVIYYEAATTGISTGRCDDLHVGGCLFICGTHINSFVGTGSNPGTTFGEVTGCDFDSLLGIRMAGGFLNLSGCFFSEGFVATGAIVLSGGTLNMSGCTINSTIPLPNGSIIMAPVTASIPCFLNMSACILNTTGNSFTLQMLNTTGGYCQAIITGCTINPDPNALTTRNCIQVGANCLLTFTGNRFGGRGSSSGVAVALATDTAHVVTGNYFANWANSFPVPYNNIVYASNSDNGGEVGRYLSATANAVFLSSTSVTSIAGLALTAGDWDVSGAVDFLPAGGAATGAVSAGLSLTGAFLGGRGCYQNITMPPVAGEYHSLAAGVLRVKITSPTTVFLLGQCNFTGGSMTANGYIGARRVGH